MKLESLTLSDGEFQQIRFLVFKTTGISLTDTKKALVVSRLARRLKDLDIQTFSEYIERLKTDTDEIHVLTNRITTNLTSFYREKRQFPVLKEVVIPDILSRPLKGQKRTLRIWSAGCSTGEEVYTILFEVCEFFKRMIPADLDFKLLGSDIDTNALQKAQSGCYKLEEMNGLEPHIVETYFEPLSDTEFKIKERYKKYVLFNRINLVNDVFEFKNKIDILFCRNVVIYFSNDTRHKVYHKFHEVLNDPGYFFSGHSENLFKYSDQYKFIGNSVYKKAV